MRITIDLPETFVMESRGARCVLNTADLSADIIARLVEHGATQKVADAAAPALADAGFKGMRFADLSDAERARVRNIAQSAMESIRDNLVAGVWAERKAGTGLSELDRAMIAEFREKVRAAFDKRDLDGGRKRGETWKAMEESDRVLAIRAQIERLSAEKRDALETLAKERIAREAAAKAARDELEVEIEL